MSVVILGDLIRDDYCMVRVDRVSPEAPCLVGLETAREQKLGGAGNVAANLRVLTSEMMLYGFCGESYVDLLNGMNHCVYRRQESVKTRFVCDKTRVQLFRWDKDSVPVEDQKYCEFLGQLRIDRKDVFVLVDYLKGAVIENHGIVGSCVNVISTKRPRPDCIAPVRISGGINILVLNQREYDCLDECLGYEYIVRTEGENGITVIRNVFRPIPIGHLDAEKVEVFDVTGAGDTVVAVIAHRLHQTGFSEPNLFDACSIANRAASKVVARPGTAIIRPEDMT